MKPIQKAAVVGTIAIASITGGAIGANLLGTATAATNSTSSTSSTATAPAMPEHGSAAHEDAETAVTGTAAPRPKLPPSRALVAAPRAP